MSDIRMSGALVERHRRTLEELLSKEEVAAALATLPPDQREEFATASTLSWVRIPTLDAAFKAIAARARRDPAALHVEVVKKSVEENMMSIWRLLLRFTSDEALVSRLPRLYARAFNGGSIAIARMVPGAADFRVEGWPDMPPYARRGLAAGTEAAIGLAGRTDVAVRSVGAEPRFLVTWRVS